MNHSEKEVKEFVENLFKNSSSELKDLYKHQYSIESGIKDEIQNIMYIYTIENDVMNMSRAEQQKEIKKLDKMIDDFYKADAEMQIEILYKLLEGTTTEVFRFYSYNANKKEIADIVKQTYKGRHFSENVWNDETETAKYMKKQLFDFIKGKVNVNQITKGVEKLFGNTHYESRRLAETEVARCQSAAFDRFASEVGVEKVKYRATLCNTCDKCKADDGKPFDFDKKIKLPRHPFCQCYYDIVDNNYKRELIGSNSKENDLDYNHMESDVKWSDYIDVNESISKSLNNIHTDLNRVILEDKTEKMVLLSINKNKIVNEEIGEIDRIQLSKETIQKLKSANKNDIILSHNHPSKTTFSSADIDKIVSFDSVKVLTLECSNGTKYTLEKGENKISLFKKYMYINKYNDIYHKVSKNYPELDDETKIYDVWDEFLNEVTKEISKEYGLIYKEVKNK